MDERLEEDQSNETTNPFSEVPVEVSVSVGRAKPLIRELLKLQANAVLLLDRKVDDPVDLFVGDKLIARGELVEIEGDQTGNLAVRLTEVIDMRNGLL